MIKVQNLAKVFGTKRAVDGVSFTVERGEVLGFLGPNGAGKSTTMRMLTGFIPPTSGTATVGGYDILTHSFEANDDWLAGECAGLIPDLTVEGFSNLR
jgi:ABC-2 type transport system ATP-binding protein